MPKPTQAAIQRTLPLSQGHHRVIRPTSAILACNLCGDAGDEPLTLWRECDERDRPIAGNDALVFIGPKCIKRMEDHPRLYVEEAGLPGYFPALCGPCKLRDGFGCKHEKLKANGGPGLSVSLSGFANVRAQGPRGCYVPLRRAWDCEGRDVASG